MQSTMFRILAAGVALAVIGPALPAGPAAAVAPGPRLALAREEAETPSGKNKKKKDKGDKEAAAEKKKEEEKPFDKVIKDLDRVEGLFTIYLDRSEAKFFLEIRPDQLNRTFLLSPTMEGGIGEKFLLAAAVLQEYPVEFRTVGKDIHFILPNVLYRAAANPEMNRALARSFSDSLLARVKRASKPHPERGSLLVDLNGLFLHDLEGVAPFLKQAYDTTYTHDKEASSIGLVKGFPANMEIAVVQHYQTKEPKASVTLPDPRSLFLTFRYSLSGLPDTGYRPRLADDRVGSFNTIFQDYSNDRRETAYVRYVQRWHIDKTDPAAPLSPAKQPIVFWLENTIPLRYRDAIRDGILMWNRAFERIGIAGALVVKQQPDDADWDPADIRYNTIRWIVAPGARFAQGPSRADPFTGQLFDADIRFTADMIRRSWERHDEFVNPLARLAPPRLDGLGHGIGPRALCSHALGGTLQAWFGLDLLTMRGEFGAGSPEAERFVHDFLVETTAHEVGHTLGLRHNFKASSIIAVADLHDAERTAVEGIGGSIMDYNPVNVAPAGQPQGQYWQTTLGPYDYWAIEYLYTPLDADSPEAEIEALDRIASRAASPELAYATDEDTFVFSPRSIDPTSNLWDFGDDPIEFYRGQIGLARELWERMDEFFDQPGNRYQKYRNVLAEGFLPYFTAAQNVPKLIGGIYTHRDHIGDPGGRVPFVAVPAERQRAALEFVRDEILAADAFRFPAGLLNKLAPERHWDFEGTPFTMQRLDYPIHNLVAVLQAPVLARLYDPITMSRIVDQQVKLPAGTDPFTLAEVFTGLRTAIWSELDRGEKINSFRRNLQRAHLDILSRIVLDPAAGTPEDARTLARADLIDLRRGIEAAIRDGTDDRTTRAHLDESGARIAAVLAAQVERRLLPPATPGP